MRVLITGSRGQVGSELVEFCAAAGDEVLEFAPPLGDITSRDSVLGAVTETSPDSIIHTAAYTNVDACETDVDRAFATNVIGCRNVAEAANRVGAHVVALSTDYVFDGTKTAPYHEWDEPHPLSVYGRSKLAGEHEIAAAHSHTVVRTSWVFGREGRNTVKTVLRLAEGNVDPAFVDDQIGKPTIVSDLVPLLRRFALERRPGLFHVTNDGALSWFDLARSVFRLAGHDPERVTRITTAELDPPRPAARPANSVLDNRALRLAGLPALPHHEASLARLVALLRGRANRSD